MGKRAKCRLCSWRGSLHRLPAHMADRHPSPYEYYPHVPDRIGPDPRQGDRDGTPYPAPSVSPESRNNHS